MAKKGGYKKAYKPKKNHPWGGAGKNLGSKTTTLLRRARPGANNTEYFLSLPEMPCVEREGSI